MPCSIVARFSKVTSSVVGASLFVEGPPLRGRRADDQPRRPQDRRDAADDRPRQFRDVCVRRAQPGCNRAARCPQELVDHGGRVFDTAPGYGASEQVAGELASALGIRDKVFWATKVNAAGREGLSGAKADPAKARARIEESFKRFMSANHRPAASARRGRCGDTSAHRQGTQGGAPRALHRHYLHTREPVPRSSSAT